MVSQFEVVSARTVDEVGQKKHVQYTVLVRKPINIEELDTKPVVIERRYTDFLDLYKSLSQDYAALTSGITFPRKVVIGNFAPSVISTRSCCFEKLLKAVADNEKLRDSASLHSFLISQEEKEAHKCLALKHFARARPLLENIFLVLSKVYTDRHPNVIVALCKLAACCSADPASLVDAERYADLALRRFDGVSDIDLLRFYIPLLRLCEGLWWTLGRDKKVLEARLNDLRRCGHRVDSCPPLLEAVLSHETSSK